MPQRIAIIEDNADNRMLIEALLSDLYDIDEYEDGLVGLVGLRRNPPALLLLDISLPHKSGTEVLAEIRADAALAHLPVIALTAHAMPGERDAFRDQGFDACVTKPIVDETLLFDAIAELLAKGRRS